jgi:hypothetical protein
MPCLITMARTHSYQPSTRRFNARRMHAETQRWTALPSRCHCGQSSPLPQMPCAVCRVARTLVAVTARFVIVADSISSPLQSEQRAPAAGIRRAPTRRCYRLCSRSSIAPAVRGTSLLAHTTTRNNHSSRRSGNSTQLAQASSPSARMRCYLLAALKIVQLRSRRHRCCRRCSVVPDQDPAAKAAAADPYAQARSTDMKSMQRRDGTEYYFAVVKPRGRGTSMSGEGVYSK